jgi:hypothetical protein
MSILLLSSKILRLEFGIACSDSVIFLCYFILSIPLIGKKRKKTAVVDFAPQLPTMSTHITIRPLPLETFCLEMRDVMSSFYALVTLPSTNRLMNRYQSILFHLSNLITEQNTRNTNHCYLQQELAIIGY